MLYQCLPPSQLLSPIAQVHRCTSISSASQSVKGVFGKLACCPFPAVFSAGFVIQRSLPDSRVPGKRRTRGTKQGHLSCGVSFDAYSFCCAMVSGVMSYPALLIFSPLFSSAVAQTYLFSQQLAAAPFPRRHRIDHEERAVADAHTIGSRKGTNPHTAAGRHACCRIMNAPS